MMKPPHALSGLALLFVFGMQPSAYGDKSVSIAAFKTSAVPGPVSGFLEVHCVGCHSEGNAEGGLDLSTLGFGLSDQATFAKWQHVHQRVRDKEMPPPSEEQPSQNEIDELLTVLGQPMLEFDRADIQANGRVRGRRLTRTEYEHTIHDLLGIDMPLRNLLPEDTASHGFETVADGQQLSHHLLAVYLDVADIALKSAFDRAVNGDTEYREFFTPKTLATRSGGNYRGPDLRDGKSISWPITLQFFGRMYPTRMPDDGWYQIKLKGVHAINPNKNGTVWGTLRSGWCEANAPLLYMIGLVEATETPRDLSFKAWIQKKHCLELKPNDAELSNPPTGAKGGNVSFENRDLAAEGFAGIVHDGIEVERIYPNSDHLTLRHNLFGDVVPESVSKEDTSETLETLVNRFVERAFRRPLVDEVVQSYVAIGQQVLDEGDSLLDALQASYRAILCSPRFLTFVETPGSLDDFAIASRLSYALWTSMPDETLFRLAREKKLLDPMVLSQQIDRLLDDHRADRFVRSYTDQWLKLNQIDFTTPEKRQFRSFDSVLQESMLQETRSFVDELIRCDRSVSSLIDSDFAFLNERLARLYDLPIDQVGVKPGLGVQQVSLGSQSTSRGGLLTQAAILKVTADGTRTSPIVRGVFVNERILGEHVPPPPPGVPAIEPDIRGAVSIRDQLDKHRSDESCSACHRVIDPPGFALENFDPIGSWRVRYGTKGEGVAVDSSGMTPQGDPFTSLKDWKGIYVQRPEQLAKTFAKHFLTYSTGAPPRFSDEETIEQMIARSAASNYGVRSLMKATLTSDLFLKK